MFCDLILMTFLTETFSWSSCRDSSLRIIWADHYFRQCKKFATPSSSCKEFVFTLCKGSGPPNLLSVSSKVEDTPLSRWTSRLFGDVTLDITWPSYFPHFENFNFFGFESFDVNLGHVVVHDVVQVRDDQDSNPIFYRIQRGSDELSWKYFCPINFSSNCVTRSSNRDPNLRS